MIIYGWGDKTIKKYNDSHIKCKNCGAYSQEFLVFQKYFHIFWIPVIPIGRKKIYCQCTECDDSSNEDKLDHYLSRTRTPIYMFAWVLIVAGIFLFNWGSSMMAQQKKDSYLNKPQIGDVYKMATDTYANKETVHFMKVVDMERDTLFVIQNAFYYENINVDEMEEDDYFIDNDIFYILKERLPELKEENTIRKIIRNYSSSSNFNRELSIDTEEEDEDEEV